MPATSLHSTRTVKALIRWTVGTIAITAGDLDPDGDGFACSFDPGPYRALN